MKTTYKVILVICFLLITIAAISQTNAPYYPQAQGLSSGIKQLLIVMGYVVFGWYYPTGNKY